MGSGALTSGVVVGEALTRLAVGRGGTVDEVTAEVYLHDLKRFDPALVVRACEHWRTVPRKEFEPALPDVGKLIQTVERIAREEADAAAFRLLPPAPVADEEGPRFYCRECRDAEWGPATWCPGAGPQRAATPHVRHTGLERVHCGRRTPHAPHTTVQRCHCWGTNPVVERRRRDQWGAHDAH